jgi:hypothetical protein
MRVKEPMENSAHHNGENLTRREFVGSVVVTGTTAGVAAGSLAQGSESEAIQTVHCSISIIGEVKKLDLGTRTTLLMRRAKT